MISIEDCIALCGLTETEAAAIAQQEHLLEVAAAVLGQYLLNQKHGPDQIRRMLMEDIRTTMKAGNAAHASALLGALRRLATTYQAALAHSPGKCHA